MAARNRRQLDCAMAGVQPAYRQRAHPRSAAKVVRPVAPAIATGFAGLDAITGYNGIPLGAITLLCGPVTFGKLTLAYKMLVGAQRSRPGGAAPNVALLNVSGAADPDYLARCGVDLARLRVASPPVGPQVLAALGRMLSDPALRVVVIDSLAELAGQASVRRQFHALLGQLQHHLRATGAALILLTHPARPGAAGSVLAPTARWRAPPPCTLRWKTSIGCIVTVSWWAIRRRRTCSKVTGLALCAARP